jgi:hypothetical protein
MKAPPFSGNFGIYYRKLTQEVRNAFYPTNDTNPPSPESSA